MTKVPHEPVWLPKACSGLLEPCNSNNQHEAWYCGQQNNPWPPPLIHRSTMTAGLVAAPCARQTTRHVRRADMLTDGAAAGDTQHPTAKQLPRAKQCRPRSLYQEAQGLQLWQCTRMAVWPAYMYREAHNTCSMAWHGVVLRCQHIRRQHRKQGRPPNMHPHTPCTPRPAAQQHSCCRVSCQR